MLVDGQVGGGRPPWGCAVSGTWAALGAEWGPELAPPSPGRRLLSPKGREEPMTDSKQGNRVI